MTTFSDVFFPIFSALIAWSAVMEIYQILIALWMSKRRAKMMQEGYARMGLDGNMPMPTDPNVLYALQNAIGGTNMSAEPKDGENAGSQAQHGQYL